MELCLTSWAEPCATTNDSGGIILNKCIINVNNIRNGCNVNCAALVICSVINNFASIKGCISRCNINTSTNALITKLVGAIAGGLISVNRATVHGEASAINVWPVIPWSTDPGVRNLLTTNNTYKLVICCNASTSISCSVVLDNAIVHNNIAIPSYVNTTTGT